MSAEITFVLVRNGEWVDEFTAVPCVAGGYIMYPYSTWDGTTRASYTNLAPYWRSDCNSAEAELEQVCRERAARIREKPEEWEGATTDLHVEVCTYGYVDREIAL